ncbi:hypothetical protein C8Q77DRAFT_253521 [Trametes polyzona]|nr:hypothetical protein C8Q77DRAFT_253521 [Trametes polyzona]
MLHVRVDARALVVLMRHRGPDSRAWGFPPADGAQVRAVLTYRPSPVRPRSVFPDGAGAHVHWRPRARPRALAQTEGDTHAHGAGDLRRRRATDRVGRADRHGRAQKHPLRSRGPPALSWPVSASAGARNSLSGSSCARHRKPRSPATRSPRPPGGIRRGASSVGTEIHPPRFARGERGPMARRAPPLWPLAGRVAPCAPPILLDLVCSLL